MERLLVTLGTLVVSVLVVIGICDGASLSGTASGGGRKAATGSPADRSPARSEPGPEIEWATLTAYDYQPGLKGLPDSIKALEGKTVVMRGFLMPLYEYDDIHEFVLVPNHMSCCFGMPTGINGQVQVTLSSARGLPNTNEPLEVRGTFHAVETKEQGHLLSIWRIDAATARIVDYDLLAQRPK